MTRTETPAPTITFVIVDGGNDGLAIGAAHSGMQDYETVRDLRFGGTIASNAAVIAATRPAFMRL